MVLAPRIELRNSKEEIKVGSSTRIGTDLTISVGRSADLVFQGSFVTGEVLQSVSTLVTGEVVGTYVGFDGTRFGVYLDWHPR